MSSAKILVISHFLNEIDRPTGKSQAGNPIRDRSLEAVWVGSPHDGIRAPFRVDPFWA